MESQIRAHMPLSRRAKQFLMYDALCGLRAALSAAERIPTPRRYISDFAVEELNRKLTALNKNQLVTVVYYGVEEQEYLQLTGQVSKVDYLQRMLRIGETEICFTEIYELFTNSYRSIVEG